MCICVCKHTDLQVNTMDHGQRDKKSALYNPTSWLTKLWLSKTNISLGMLPGRM